MKIRLEFKKEDLWIGVFWRRKFTGRVYADIVGYDAEQVDLWICLIPCLPIHLTWTAKHSLM